MRAVASTACARPRRGPSGSEFAQPPRRRVRPLEAASSGRIVRPSRRRRRHDAAEAVGVVGEAAALAAGAALDPGDLGGGPAALAAAAAPPLGRPAPAGALRRVGGRAGGG